MLARPLRILAPPTLKTRLFGFLGFVTSTIAIIVPVAAGEIPAEGLYMLIPALIFGILLIGSSVLAWHDG